MTFPLSLARQSGAPRLFALVGMARRNALVIIGLQRTLARRFVIGTAVAF
jgi:hypothetical protein